MKQKRVEKIPAEIKVKSEIKKKKIKKESQDEKRKNFELGFRIKLWVRGMGHLLDTDKTTYLAKTRKLTMTDYLEAL